MSSPEFKKQEPPAGLINPFASLDEQGDLTVTPIADPETLRMYTEEAVQSGAFTEFAARTLVRLVSYLTEMHGAQLDMDDPTFNRIVQFTTDHRATDETRLRAYALLRLYVPGRYIEISPPSRSGIMLRKLVTWLLHRR